MEVAYKIWKRYEFPTTKRLATPSPSPPTRASASTCSTRWGPAEEGNLLPRLSPVHSFSPVTIENRRTAAFPGEDDLGNTTSAIPPPIPAGAIRLAGGLG